MTDRAVKNTWVEIGGVVLQKDQRASNLPDDTKQVPLEMRVKGFLVHDADKGAEAEIIGRAVDVSTTNAAARHPHGETVMIVVATVDLSLVRPFLGQLHGRGATEFAAPDHQRLV